MIIKEIDNEIAINFLRANNAQKEQIIITNKDVWYGIYKDNNLIGVRGVKIKKTYVKFGGFYILKNMRGKGYGKVLANHLINIYHNENIITYSRPITTHINCKYFNFKILKTYKNGISKLERKGDNK